MIMRKKLYFTIIILLATGLIFNSAFAAGINCWFPPAWKSKPQQAKAICKVLSEETGITINPRIAKSYPQILKAFDSSDQNLVYVGSFVQSIIKARNLGTSLVQNINGKELYSGVLVYPKGEDPEKILRENPEKIAFAKGASSGESTAKAATNGKAEIGTANHGATCGAVKSGKASAGVVKNWWWDSNKSEFPMLDMYKIPGVSIEKNPGNVLTASKAVPADIQKKITDAAIAGKEAFGAPELVFFLWFQWHG
jgi:ABC-type phosphate/phosphonate transport system substrate-binding protein